MANRLRQPHHARAGEAARVSPARGGTSMDERTGEAFELGERLTAMGRKLQPGDAAPDFALDSFDPATSIMHVVRLADSTGMVRLLNVVNSLDTPVCHAETRRWETLLEELPPEVRLYTVSM